MALPLIPIAVGAAAAAAAGIAFLFGRRKPALADEQDDTLDKARRLAKSLSPDEPLNNLYVVCLDPKVWKKKPKFRRDNPDYDPASGLPCVYVGTTAHEPSFRFRQHKADHQANRFARDYGERLMMRSEYDPKAEFPPNPVPACPEPTRAEPRRTRATRLEALLARWLREKDWAVYSK